MAIRDLIPWNWGSEKQVPVKREDQAPVYALQRSIDHLFDDFFRGFNLVPFGETWGDFSPPVDVTESDREYKVSAELPGMDENDIEVTVANNILTISGEKKEEKEDKGQDYYRLERSYGSFRRSIPLPPDTDSNKIDANFKKGVLSITLPKTAEAQAHYKRISVKSK
ncbi:MAG: Hsp20/alpha crystallin family protein [Anaerolineae bacterium]|nr:Hsp20/alpha crystallin family protein [Anaerolineae bacterium]